MRNISNNLLVELENKLNQIHNTQESPIEYSIQGSKASSEVFEKLKNHFKKHTFNNKQEEIEFFREIKPLFTSKLIYYNTIYNMEISKPKGTPKTIRKHYNVELQKIKNFFKENIEFYKYYRSNNRVLDKIYFLRKTNKVNRELEYQHFKFKSKWATSHDYKVAKIKANENIQDYIENKLKNIRSTETTNNQNKANTIKWTGSKVALVELMYALHCEGVLNNGSLSLKEIASEFETIFNLEMGQFHRIFLEIRGRKTIEKTNFINTLKESLIKKIENTEEK